MSKMLERAVVAGLAELQRQAREDGPYVGEDGMGNGNPEGLLVDGHIDLCAIVRAVIKAMREPTEAMWQAGCDALKGVPLAEIKRLDRWRAMIDAALADD